MKAYSKYWRKNRSQQEAIELALSLRALRKVAGHFGGNANPVFWKGMAEVNNESLVFDVEAIKGKYPIPHQQFDILVGKVVREELSVVEQSGPVIESVLQTAPEAPEFARPYLENLIEAAEDIYIHERVRPEVWSLYMSRFWRAELFHEQKNQDEPLNAESLANAWRNEAILGEASGPLHHYYGDLLDLLNHSANAVRKLAAETSPETRRQKRIDLYVRMWADAAEIISSWQEYLLGPGVISLFDKVESEVEASGVKSGEEQTEETDKLTEKQETETLEPDLADEVSSLLAEDGTGQPQTVAVSEPSPHSLGTVFMQSQIKSGVKADPLIVRRLRRIFREQKALMNRTKKKAVRKALPAGKLDARRLFRVPLDEKVFQNRQVPRPDRLWQICIVTDASASMAGRGQSHPPWEVAEKTFVSLAEAAKGFKNHLDIYAYNEEKQICKLTQLYRNHEIYTLTPAGRTPSGKAILAAAMRLDRKYKKSMIIHITDGASNCGLPLPEAVQYCLDNHIEIFNIGCGCTRQTKQFLREYFPPARLFFMQDISYLADGLEQLFKRKILGSS